MKWGQPVWEHNGPFAWLRPAAKHVSFGFWRGAEMNDPEGHLDGEGERMRHLKMTSAADLKSLPIEGFVKQAVELNGANGDPTKRKVNLYRAGARRTRTFASTATSAGGNAAGSRSSGPHQATSATSMALGSREPGSRCASKKRRSTALSASS